MKKLFVLFLLCLMMFQLAACGEGTSAAATAGQGESTPAVEPEKNIEAVEEAVEMASVPASGPVLEDGVYTVDFNTDSGMFHINEALEGKATLTVQNGEMNVHITLVSKSILNLFPGTAEAAKETADQWLQPTEDEVTYKDGYTEVVYGFDVPVPYLDAEFPLALIGKKGTWYDHMVSVTNPVPMEN